MLTSKKPPHLRGTWFGGNLAELRRGSLALYTRAARECGDVAVLRFGPRRVWLVSHPDLIEDVLVTKSKSFIKHFGLRMNRRVLGDGLLTSEGDFWLRQRRLAQPAFSRERVAEYAAAFGTFADRLIEGWRDGETRDVHTDMTRLTLEITAKALFDADAGGQAQEVGEAMAALADGFNNRFYRLFRMPAWAPTATNRKREAAAARLDAIVYGLIKSRRSGQGRSDLLDLLLQARDEGDGAGMTDRQLRDEVMTLFVAGHETTALALSWTLYLLARHPIVQDVLAEEVEKVLAGRTPTAADLPQLAFTERVVLESMRLYPPAYIIGRQAVADVELGGYRLPRGGTVLMSQWIVHRDPRFFENPEQFAPERWQDGLARRLPKYAYFPFGGGPRVCIGNNFAQTEIVLVLAAIARRFRFSWPTGAADVAPQPAVTLRPNGPIRLTVHKRGPG